MGSAVQDVRQIVRSQLAQAGHWSSSHGVEMQHTQQSDRDCAEESQQLVPLGQFVSSPASDSSLRADRNSARSRSPVSVRPEGLPKLIRLEGLQGSEFNGCLADPLQSGCSGGELNVHVRGTSVVLRVHADHLYFVL